MFSNVVVRTEAVRTPSAPKRDLAKEMAAARELLAHPSDEKVVAMDRVIDQIAREIGPDGPVVQSRRKSRVKPAA